MKQIGIIYKFTIVAKYKFDGHKPFYVGQHFGLDDFDTYLGSGAIWTDFITRLKLDFPTCWRKLIKREVLYQRPCSQIALDALEAHFIKKEQSHYSYQLGGCNILWGTSNEFGSGSPMKDPMIAAKCAKTLHEKYSGENSWMTSRKFSKETRDKIRIAKIGSIGPNRGKKFSEETKQKMRLKALERFKDPRNNPMYGKKHSDETRRLMSMNHADISGENNPMKNAEVVKRNINSRKRNKI